MVFERTHSPAARISLKRIKLQPRLLAAVFVLSFALDFKGPEGGSPIQYMMIVLNTITFALLFIHYRAALPGSGLKAFIFWGWCFFICVGSLGALINSVPLGQYIRTVYPYVLFGEGFLVAFWIAGDKYGARSLSRIMWATALISSLFTLWWGFHFTGEGVDAIRYQILSPLVTFLITTAGYDLLFTRARKLRSLIVLCFATSLIVISVTRGILFAAGMVFAEVFMIWMWTFVRRPTWFPRPIRRLLFWMVVISVTGMGATVTFAPAVSQRWVQRSVGAGSDATFWTRVAAAVSQWRQLLGDPTAWIVGKGFGHSYQYAQDFASYVFPYVTPTSFAQSMWYPAEFMWITPLYYGGFIAGSVGVAVFLCSILQVFKTLVTRLTYRDWKVAENRAAWVGTLGFLSLLNLSFTSDPFITRLAALFFGLTLGLAIMPRRNNVTVQIVHKAKNSGR